MRGKRLLLAILLVASFVRLWRLDEVPLSLFSDELDVGYQAYSILKTGKDYSGNPWPMHFESYVERRAPVYIYSAVPTVAIFGITPYGIRLPAAIFGILGVLMIYLLAGQITRSHALPLLAALVLALSPWHIHYSRAAFEASELVFLILSGLYFFFKSFKKPKFLLASALFFGLAPWTYSTAKLFIPVFVLFLIAVYRKELFAFPGKYLKRAFLMLSVLSLPLVFVILFGGGAQRFGGISIFSDQTATFQVDLGRMTDATSENPDKTGLSPSLLSKLIHNKPNFWRAKIITNYLQAFSTEFLFLKGDVSPRQSTVGFGQFYQFEIILLILGAYFFYRGRFDKKIKLVLGFWILFGALPSALTNEGGAHATRLILLLPPLVFLVSMGVIETLKVLKKPYRYIFIVSYALVLAIVFFLFEHNYWVHNPEFSEKSWHAGFKEAILAAKKYESEYESIVITTAEERPWIFLAAYTNYDPEEWQIGFEEGYVSGFGTLKKIGKYYFGQAEGTIGMDKLGAVMDEKTLYLAAQRELEADLVTNPEKTPEGLRLVEPISLPSGERAFYLLAIPKATLE